jgi:hypothetical protein
MPSFAPHEIIPIAYRGREQAYIKHLLLEGYLERLLYIIGWNAGTLGHSEVVFVDCFSGRGKTKVLTYPQHPSPSHFDYCLKFKRI